MENNHIVTKKEACSQHKTVVALREQQQPDTLMKILWFLSQPCLPFEVTKIHTLLTSPYFFLGGFQEKFDNIFSFC